MKKTSFRAITDFAICAVIIAALSLTHLAWGQGEQAEAEQVQREAPRDAGGAEKGAVARILAGVEEGRISKEKATEMIAALSKSIDQENQEEDRNLKEMLEGYWRADPSIRAGYAMRIEMYLQHMAAGQGRNNERGGERADQRRGERRRRGERPLSPAVARLHREAGSFDFTARINMDAVGQDGGVINLQGTADVQMILDGQFLLNRGLQAGNESVTIIGVTGGDDDERSMKAALKVMRDADKLTDEQVEELFNIVFPKDIEPEKSTRQRLMSFSMRFVGLIDSDQVECFDKDMKKVHDVGVAEIERQGGKKERGQAEDRARAARLRENATRVRKRAVPGTLKWSIRLGGIVGYCSPAIAEDGTIYIGGGEKTLHALNPDGTKKWSFAASGAVVSAPAIGKDSTIYIGTHGRRIHAITADGAEKWSYPVGDKIDFSSPSIGKDGTIYIGCYDDHLYAMNPDGTKKWSFRAEFNLFSSPAVGQDGTIYIGSENGNLYAVNPEDGSKKWDFQTGYFIHGSPSIAKDGTVYIGSSDKNLYAIDPKDGSEKWRFTAKDQVHAPPAIGKDGTLYVGSNDGNFYALNPDGTEKWRFRTAKRVDNCSAAIGKDGTIYFGSDDNHIYALNPDGSEKWRFEMNGVDDMDSSPAIGADGTIYVASRDGNLYAINGESGGLAKTPWPMFGLDPHHTGRARPGGYSPTAMKLIPQGQYEMGSHSTNPIHDKLNTFALPVHTVSIDAFWMDVYELTNQKYCEYLNSAYGLGLIEVSDGVVQKAGDTELYCDTHKSSPNSRIHWDGKVFTVTQGKEDHPMVEVSWYGAVAFANWKSAKAGLTPCYNLETWEYNFAAKGFRLPTEAEWEKAARGGEHNPYYDWPWGNSKDGSNANYYMSGDPFDYDMPATTPVGYYDGGQTPPGADMENGYGLYDMAGNVFEWCYDWYDKNYYSVSPKDNPRGPESGTTRVCRCGSWAYTWSTAMRVGLFHPDYRGSTVGFRLVRKN